MWNHNLLAKIVEEEVITHAIDLVRSFVKLVSLDFFFPALFDWHFVERYALVLPYDLCESFGCSCNGQTQKHELSVPSVLET